MSSSRPRAEVERYRLPMEGIRVRVRAFALAAQTLGRSSLERTLPPDATVADLLTVLFTDYPALAELGPRLRTAIGTEYVTADRRLHDGEEVILLPPVSGG